MEVEAGTGLSNCIAKDSRGYLWIGTLDTGLWRYDGYHSQNYSSFDSTKNQNSFAPPIECIHEDRHGELWVGTKRGLFRYLHANDSFVSYVDQFENPRKLDIGIPSIYEDSNGVIWAVTRFEIHRYNRKSDTFESFSFRETTDKDFRLGGICQDHDGNYWVSCNKAGIWLFKEDSETFEYIPDPSDQLGNAFRKLFPDSKGNIWIGTRGHGLIRFEPNNRGFTHYPTDSEKNGTKGNQIYDILEYPEGQLLVAVNQGGLNRLNLETGAFSYQCEEDATALGLNGNGLTDFQVTQSGELWMCTARSGIDYYSPYENLFYSYNKDFEFGDQKLQTDIVTWAEEDDNGELWIGFDAGGIAIFDRKNHSITTLSDEESGDPRLRSDVVVSIQQDHKNRFWVCTWDGGIVLLEKEKGEIVRNTKFDKHYEKYITKQLASVTIDSKDRKWISDYEGLMHLHDAESKYVKTYYSAGYIFGGPITLHETSKGMLLQSSFQTFLLNESTLEFEEFIAHPNAKCSYYDSSLEQIFVGTRSNGVLVYDTQGREIDRIDTTDGLSSNSIASIERSNSGKLWIATNEGLNEFDPTTTAVVHFTKEDGLPGNQFFERASLKLEDGSMFFGSHTGFTIFEPNAVGIKSPMIPIVIDDILINNKSILVSDFGTHKQLHPHSINELNLNWQQRGLTFHFTGINLTHPSKIQYAYKLKGFDKDWVYTNSKHRIAKYTNLPPGTYAFTVKTSTIDDVWNENERVINVWISPPFWEKWSFRATMIVLSLLIVLSLMRWRERKLRRDKALLEGHVAERTKTIEDQKSELEGQSDELRKHQFHLEELIVERTKELIKAKDRAEHSDRLKSSFLANISHEIRTPLNAIVGLSSVIDDPDLDSESREEYVSAIATNSDSLLRLIEDILDFSLIESDQIRIQHGAFNLRSFLDNIYSSAIASNPNDNIKVSKSIDLPTNMEILMMSDETRLKQILDNLLSNAFKYSNQGTVELSAKIVNKQLILSVSDEGDGIPPKHQQSIFNEFTRLDVHEIMAKRGVGLGLAIVNRLSKMLEGELKLVSEPQKGSIFSISFSTDLLEFTSANKRFKAQNQTSNEWAGKRFLIVEDEPANYFVLRDLLETKGASVDWAKDYLETFNILRTTARFDLVLLDIRLPEKDGFEILKHIREEHPDLIVIAQTAYSLKEDRIKINRAGFDGYLPKPINSKELYRILADYV